MDEAHDSQTLGRRVNELVLLSALWHAPMHGYQVGLEIERRSGGYFRFNHGTLYPILHRLEKEGRIAGDWTDPESGRARKRYALTEAGRTYVAETVRAWRRLEAELAPFLDVGGRTDEPTDERAGEPVRTSAA